MPLIGVTPNWDGEKRQIAVNEDYMEALRRAGALPVVLPLTDSPRDWDEIAGRVDGLLFTGGVDLEPRLYREETLDCCGEISLRRDQMEWGLMCRAVEGKLPLLGICRGFQILNCLLGGSLYQDIAAQTGSPIVHPRHDLPKGPAHEVKVEKDSLLGRIVNCEEMQVNSRHHQGVKRLAQRLRPIAFAPDGLIEAVEMPEKPFVLGVQWHPESMSGEDEKQQAIFNAFAEACEG